MADKAIVEIDLRNVSLVETALRDLPNLREEAVE